MTVILDIKAKSATPVEPWPYDDTYYTYVCMTRSMERRGCGEVDEFNDANDGRIEFSFEFATKDAKQARRIVAETFREFAPGWLLSTRRLRP